MLPVFSTSIVNVMLISILKLSISFELKLSNNVRALAVVLIVDLKYPLKSPIVTKTVGANFP